MSTELKPYTDYKHHNFVAYGLITDMIDELVRLFQLNKGDWNDVAYTEVRKLAKVYNANGAIIFDRDLPTPLGSSWQGNELVFKADPCYLSTMEVRSFHLPSQLMQCMCFQFMVRRAVTSFALLHVRLSIGPHRRGYSRDISLQFRLHSMEEDRNPVNHYSDVKKFKENECLESPLEFFNDVYRRTLQFYLSFLDMDRGYKVTAMECVSNDDNPLFANNTFVIPSDFASVLTSTRLLFESHETRNDFFLEFCFCRTVCDSRPGVLLDEHCDPMPSRSEMAPNTLYCTVQPMLLSGSPLYCNLEPALKCRRKGLIPHVWPRLYTHSVVFQFLFPCGTLYGKYILLRLEDRCMPKKQRIVEWRCLVRHVSDDTVACAYFSGFKSESRFMKADLVAHNFFADVHNVYYRYLEDVGKGVQPSSPFPFIVYTERSFKEYKSKSAQTRNERYPLVCRLWFNEEDKPGGEVLERCMVELVDVSPKPPASDEVLCLDEDEVKEEEGCVVKMEEDLMPLGEEMAQLLSECDTGVPPADGEAMEAAAGSDGDCVCVGVESPEFIVIDDDDD